MIYTTEPRTTADSSGLFSRLLDVASLLCIGIRRYLIFLYFTRNNENERLFSGLPPELRLQIYKYFFPVPPERPQCIEQDSFQPDQYVRRESWPSLLRLCEQIRDEAEDEFHRQQKIKIGFYGISKDAFFFPKLPHCRTRVHVLGQYRDEDPLDAQRYLHNLFNVINLEVDIFVSGDRKYVEHFWHLQDRLYELVSDLSDAQASIKNLRINLSIVNFSSLPPNPAFREVSDWSPYTELWPQMWGHFVFLLEPFQFLRGLNSAKIGTLSVWRFFKGTLQDIRGPWHEAGSQGEFKKRMEGLMVKKKPTTGLLEMWDLYGRLNRLFLGCGHKETWNRVHGDVDKMSRVALKMLTLPAPTGTIEMENWADDFQDWVDFERATRRCAKYFTVPLYREMCAEKANKAE